MSTPSPKSALIKGAAWTIGSRWSIKLIGFANTVIMARILVPEDYGIVAMAFLALEIVRSCFEFGAVTALLRKDKLERAEIDSAWTLRLLQGILIGALVLALMPLATIYFKEPRVGNVLFVLGICVAIFGASNIGPVLAQKEFNFALDFKIQLIQNISRVAATIIAGLYIPDYRALVIGLVVGYIVPLTLSYTMHPYRPRWDTTKIGEIWAVTKWLMFANVGGFILRKGDELIAARLGTSAEYGQYNVGADLGQMPVGEVGPAMMRPLLPVLASIKDDAERTRKAVIKTVAAVNTVIWPLGLGFSALAVPATTLLLGERWIGSAIFVGLFAISSILQAALSPLNTLLVLHGHTRTQMNIVWLEFLSFALAAIFLAPAYHLIGLVYARLLGSATNLIATALMTKKYCQLPFADVAAALIRPITGSLGVALIANQIINRTEGIILQIGLAVLASAVFYIVWSVMTWLVAKRPEGFESTVIDFVRHRLAK